MTATIELTVKLKTPHEKQREFIESPAKRKVIKAGRRSGKTTGMAMYAIDRFLAGKRVIYAAPTQDQTDKFWFEVVSALGDVIEAGLYKMNQTRRYIERPGSENRLRAKTAWDADSMRGDYGDEIILDEYQRMNPDITRRVVFPMLLDTDGNLTVIFTPDDENEKGYHAREFYHAAENAQLEAEEAGEEPRWQVFSFSSFDNPHLDTNALSEITEDMDELAYKQEILAQHLDETPGALWNRMIIARTRLKKTPDLGYIVVGVDPAATTGEHGIIVAGRHRMDDGKMHAFILADHTMRGKPGQWGNKVVTVYELHLADKVIGEINNGGDMVESTIKTIKGGERVSFKSVRASRGKETRAQPVASLYSEGRVHHIGEFEQLEKQMCMWVPGSTKSPDRLDAMVWAVTELLLGPTGWVRGAA